VAGLSRPLRDHSHASSLVHRLIACLAFLLRLSPVYEEQIAPLMEVFQGREVLKNKLDIVKKPDVQKLITEVADKLIVQ
jgi:desumoylating isopeptidase 1